MKIASPHNLFTRLLFSGLSELKEHEIIYSDSSLLSAELTSGKFDAAFLPSFDLINNRELFISGKHALSFFRSLGNAYYYFQPDLQEIDTIHLSGDISSLEVILTSILFREKYASDVKLELLPAIPDGFSGNLMVAGDNNFVENKFMKGLSFTEEITEVLGMPFVNYVFCAKDEKVMKDLNRVLEALNKNNQNKLNEILNSYNFIYEAKDFIEDELGGISFQFTSELQTALQELFRLPYYHGILDDMFDLKFIMD